MASSEDELLLAQLATNLAAIATPTYTNTIYKVSRDLVLPTQMGVYPSIVLAAEESRREEASSARIHAVMRIELFIYAKPTGAAVADTLLRSLLKDTDDCMQGPTNYHHGGYAEWVQWLSDETFPVVGEGIHAAVQRWDIGFTYTRGSR